MAERATTLKHDPIAEYHASMYRTLDDKAPTRLHMPSGAFKQAIAAAALDTPGATKAQIGRLTDIEGINVSIYGIPMIDMRMVRQAGMNRTPDVRTRAIFAKWGAILTVQFARSMIGEKQVANLLGAAGEIIGVGDYRAGKGAGSFGKWRCVSEDNAEFADLLRNGGMKAQDAAIAADPVAFNYETEELLAWFLTEVVRREKVVPSTKKTKPSGAVLAKSKNGKSREATQ